MIERVELESFQKCNRRRRHKILSSVREVVGCVTDNAQWFKIKSRLVSQLFVSMKIILGNHLNSWQWFNLANWSKHI